MRVDTMIDRVVARFIGTKHERDVKKIQPLVNAISALAPEYEQLSDAQMLEKTSELRTQVKERLGELPLDDPEFKKRCKGRWNQRWCRPSHWCAKRAAGSSACGISMCS